MNEGTLLDLAGHEADLRFRLCLLRCACSCTQTQPFTMPMPILTKKDRATNVWHERVSVSVLDMACVVVCVADQESSEKTEVGACRSALDLGRYMQVNSVTKG